MSVKLSMFGQALEGGHELALANVRPVVEAAAAIGTTVTLDAEDHTTLDSMFAIHEELRKDFPQTGCVIQAYLFRTEADARRLAAAGSRVRIVKGAYKEPAEVAYQDKGEIDKAYVRILKILMEGEGYPMIGSHDPRLIAIGQELARRAGRKLDEYEFQMLYGIRSEEHMRLAAEGHRMRVYTAYGTDWYGYFMRRLAEKPGQPALLRPLDDHQELDFGQAPSLRSPEHPSQRSQGTHGRCDPGPRPGQRAGARLRPWFPGARPSGSQAQGAGREPRRPADDHQR